MRNYNLVKRFATTFSTTWPCHTIRTIPVIKKLGAPTKHLKTLVCYDFHFEISNEEDLMFATEPGLFSIGIIFVLTLLEVD